MLAPRTSSEVLPQLEVQKSFMGGMRDRDHPSLLAENEYAYMRDGVVRNAGLFAMRQGRTARSSPVGSVPQDMFYFEPQPGQGRLIQFNQGVPYQWQGASGWSRIGTALTLVNQTDLVSMAAINSTVYVFGGYSDDVWTWNGVAADWTDEGDGNTHPPKAYYAAVQSGMLLSAGAASSTAIPSNDIYEYIFASNVFPSSGSGWDLLARNMRLSTKNIEPVTAIGEYRDGQILAFTRNTTWIVNLDATTPSDSVLNLVDPKVGCVAPKTLVCVGEDAFFLSGDKQLRTIKRTQLDKASSVSIPVSYNVPNLFSRITASAMRKACATVYDNYLLLAVPVDGSSYNNAVFVFDLLIQTAAPFGNIPICVGEWTNMRVGKFVTANFNNTPQLYYMDSHDGTLYQMFANQQQDDSDLITCSMKTRGLEFKNPRCDKTAKTLEYTLIGVQGNLTVNYAKDDAVFNNLITSRAYGGSLTPTLDVQLDFTLAGSPAQTYDYLSLYGKGRSRNWQLEFAFTGLSFSLKEFSLTGGVHAIKTR